MRVYVAGPMGKDRVKAQEHCLRAIEVADALCKLGFFPFVPQLSVWWHDHCPREYEDWLAYDFEWLSFCHCLLRLPGESPGADREVNRAKLLGIPVYFSVEELVLKEGNENGC